MLLHPRAATTPPILRWLTVFLVGLQPAAQGSPQPTRSSLQPDTLRVEYLVAPLAVGTREPRLSWGFTDQAVRGARQTAYHVLVASSSAQLDAGRGDLWDSGKVESSDTVHVAYAGTPLGSRARAFWKVRAWDERGRLSAWSDASQWTTGLLADADWTASWIGHSTRSTADVSATMLRRRFMLATSPARAIVYVSALGLYELRINGERVGDQQLAPEWTDYRVRVQYQAHDVTRLLHTGENVIAAHLGDGWYAGAIARSQMLSPVERNIYGDHPRLIVQLEATMPDGRGERVVSDATWRTTRDGPIRSADLLHGETWDARREPPGWDAPGFDDSTWAPADVAAGISTRLVSQPNEPIRVIQTITPHAVTEPKPGVFIVDLGQNIVGWCRITARGPAGTTVTMRHAEVLDEKGALLTASLGGARATDRFTLRGGGDETWEPRFTIHGFRYVEVTGLPARPSTADIAGRVVHSDVAFHGSFESSDDRLNALFRNITWSQRASLLGVPIARPQRDERLGWTADALVFAHAGAFNAGLAAFLRKWLTDVRDAQADDGRLPDFAPHPFGRNDRFTGTPGSADAGVVVAWAAYLHYGDTRLLAEQYEAAKRWVDFVARENPDGLWVRARGNDYGDVLNGDAVTGDGWPRVGGQVPKHVFATAMHAHAADLLARLARALDRQEEAAAYAALSERTRQAFTEAYVEPDGRMTGNTQAGYVLALAFDLVPPEMRAEAAKRLVGALTVYDGHASTGLHTTGRLLLELSRAGRDDLAYEIAQKRTLPSWGHAINRGATTMWEQWDGTSFNHYASGTVGEWIYRAVLGINPDETQPGFRRIVIRPRPGGDLSWAKGAHRSVRGTIATEWRQDGEALDLDVTVPPNTTASIHIPARDASRVTESSKPIRQAPGLKLVGAAEGVLLLEAGAGHYSFSVR